MRAGWFTSSSQLDEQIEKATSSSLEDLTLNLEISDSIRSKAVGSKEAMRSLKKRLENKNPNTQLGTLKLTDTCVKNGGSHFHSEIASREYMDNLVSLLKAQGGAEVNQDVKIKILELIQSWATAIGGKKFSYIQETYDGLLRDGFQFPPKVDVAKSMFDSYTPPDWTDSDVCMRCRAAFTFTNRKHHCRYCGNAFDQQCSSKSLPLPDFGILVPVRVDDGCYLKLTSKPSMGHSFTDERSPTNRHPHQNRPQSLMQPRSARVDDIFDEDFKKALAMSLEDVNGHSGIRSYEPPKSNSNSSKINDSKKHQIRKPSEDEEDEDLKAAIAASLADMEEQKKKHSAKIKEQARTSGNQIIKTPVPLANEHNLTPVEADSINLFSNLVDRLQTQPPGAILREPQIQELYDNISKLRPKLVRTYGETMSKHDSLLDLHAKLSSVVRYYDRLLEERLSNTYKPHAIGRSNLPQRPASTLYPQISQDIANGITENYYTSNYQNDRKTRNLYNDNFPQNSHRHNDRFSVAAPILHSGHGGPEYGYAQSGISRRNPGWPVSDPSTMYGSQQTLNTEPSSTALSSDPQQAQLVRNPNPHILTETAEVLSSPSSYPNTTMYYNSPQSPAPFSSNSQLSTSQQVESNQSSIHSGYPMHPAGISLSQNFYQTPPLQQQQAPSQPQQQPQQQVPSQLQQLPQQQAPSQPQQQPQQQVPSQLQQLPQQQAPSQPQQQPQQQVPSQPQQQPQQQVPSQLQQLLQQQAPSQPQQQPQQPPQQAVSSQPQQQPGTSSRYQEQKFWQQCSLNTPQQWQPPPNFNQYSPEYIPSPPQHILKQPIVEECLIEL